MLSGEYPPRWGGMGSTVFHLAGALVKQGHRVTVITRRDKSVERNPTIIPQQKGVSVLSVKWAPLPMAFTVSYGKWALRELLRINRQDPFDAVHVHAPMISWKEKQYRTVREKVGPVITSLHGSWLGERDGMTRAAKHGESAVWKNPNDLAILLTAKHYAKYERAAVRASTLCVANSEATKADFQARYDPQKTGGVNHQSQISSACRLPKQLAADCHRNKRGHQILELLAYPPAYRPHPTKRLPFAEEP